MRKWAFGAGMLLLVGVAFLARGQRAAARSQREMRAEVDSIMVREDLSRVYCRVIGRPHTSHRIDSVTFHSLSDERIRLKSTDIDPLYYERGFQWEDEGEIALELDFPTMAPEAAESFYMIFHTPYGQVYSTYRPALK